jgi:hypothetical protein
VKKGFILLPVLILFALLIPRQTLAFSSASDTITTSRPSSSTPLNGNATAGNMYADVYDNKSIFLASDSARLWVTAGHTGPTPENIYVASASADRTRVYFNSNLASTHPGGYTVLTNGVAARHTITFTLSQNALVNEKINIVFPQPAAGDVYAASPSATAFMGLSAGVTTGITMTPSAGGTCTITVPNNYTITCTVTGSQIAAGATITAVVGSSTPFLLNPTKGNTIGTADSWRLTLRHLTSADGPTGEADYRVAIATIENVEVTAQIDATITWTIAGIPDGINLYSDGTWGNSGCNSTGFNFTTNAGAGSTATPNAVNLGYLTNNPNYAAQKFTISTNAPGGYVLTATSSGKLKSKANGWEIANVQGTNLTANNTPAPAAMPGGDVDAFGISACGTNANASFDTNPAAYGNPATGTPGTPYSYTLASYNGPVGSDNITVVYGAKAKSTSPAGVYKTTLSYMVTATF